MGLDICGSGCYIREEVIKFMPGFPEKVREGLCAGRISALQCVTLRMWAALT